MPEDPPDLALRADRIVRAATGSAVTSVQAIAAGRMTFKYCVTTERGRAYIVRIYPAGREQVADFEPALLARMRRHGMAVPEMVSWSGAESELPHMVYERIAGRSLDTQIDALDDASLEKICAAMAEQLAIMAALPVSGFGELAGAEAGRHATWADFVRDAASAPISEAATERAMLERARTAVASAARARTAPVTPALVWTDISPENVIVGEDGNFAGLIDFEGAMALEPEATLGYLEARYLGTRFHRHCRTLIAIADDRAHLPSFYAVVRGLRLQPYLQGALPAGGRRDRLDEFLPGLSNACEELIERGKNG